MGATTRLFLSLYGPICTEAETLDKVRTMIVEKLLILYANRSRAKRKIVISGLDKGKSAVCLAC
jgi:hypothetical protein